MAIYHTHISSGSRDDGQSAAVKVAYILREGAYGGRGDLVKWGSGNMPAWAFTDPRRLFAAADLYERANGRLFVHVWVALPNELNALQRHQLVLAIVAAMAEAGLPYVYAIHAGDPKSEGEPANPHAHFVLSERVNDGIARDERQWFKRANRRNPVAGGAAKDRSLKELTWVEDTRKRVEELTNEHLDRAECEERVTADSHAKRIAVADAEGDQETAEYLRLHPPGIHLGPAAAAMERDRYRGKKGEEPELARTGEPTERGNVARTKAAEKERTRRELERVSKDLHRAREEERCAMGSVALARSVWLSDAEILDVYEGSESVVAGTGWVGIAAAAELLAGWKDQAQAEAESFGIDVEAVVRGAHARGENAVTAVQQAIGIFQDARLALMTNEVIARIQAEAESSDSGSGWGAVAEVVRTRLAWKARTEAAAREAGIGDIDDIYTAAWSREEDPLPALEAATAEREYQARIVSEARAALLTDAAIARIREEAEVSEPGSGWAAVEAATAVQAARKEQAEAGAVAAGVFEIEAVYAGAWKWREDPVAALEEATAIFAEARAALLPDVEIWRIHDAAESAEPGSGWASVKAASASRQAQKEGAEAGATTFGLDIEGVYAGAQAGGADPVVALEEKVAEEERLASERRAAVEQREGSVTATKQGRAWLLAAQQEALGGSGGQLTLEQREKIVETVYQRLDEALRDSESALRSIPQALQYLPEVVGGAERLSTLAERESMVMTAEQRLGEELDDREERLVKSAGSDEYQLISEAAESRRAAQRQDLFQQPGAEDLYYAWLADLDPTWVPGGQTAAANIDAALSATASDSGRLGLLRDVLADPVDAACYRAALYRAVLGVRRDRFTVADLDAAVAEALRRRAKAAARKREEEKRELEAKEHRAARYEALSDAGQELYTARLTALAPAGSRAGGPPGAVVARALDETELDGRLQDLEAIFADAEHRSYYRSLLVASGDQVTLEQIDSALKATEAVVRRKQTIFEYPGNKDYPAGGALYAAAREALAPDWRPGAELPAGLLDQVESQLADRVRGAADIVEASIPTTQPWSHRPDYRVPAVSDELLDQLVQDDDNAFFKAVVAELRKRYARRAHYDTPYAERYNGAARQASQEKHLVPSWSTVLARVLKSYLSRLREIVLAACDRILGGDLGERLARRRTQVERAADAAEAGLPRTQPGSYGPQVPAVSDETLEQVVTDKSTPFLKEVVAEVCDRYDRRGHAAYEERYDHEARRKSEGSHLNGVIENKHARAGRLWLRSNRSSPRPTRESVEASVVKDHRSTVLEVFEVACDEVVGRGELGAQLREHRAQVQQAAAAAEKALPTPRPERDRPKSQVPAVSDETLEHAAAGKSDPFLQEVVAEVLARYDLRAGFDVAREERYDHEARRNSEGSHLNGVIENKHARAGRLWLRSNRSSPRPTRESVEASVVKDHRSTVLEVFEVACDEVVGHGELGAQLREHRAQVQQAAAAAEKALPTPRPERDRPKSQVPAVSDETLEHAAAGKSDPFLQEVVAEVLARYDLRAGFDVAREERYDHEARRNSEGSHLNGVIENKHARAGRLWLRSNSSSPRPTRESVEASVVKDHRSTVLEVFEVACDEVVGHGELGAQLREHRAQVQRVVDAVAPSLPATESYGRPGRHVPAVSDETLAEVRAGADAFLQKVVDLVWDRYDRCADYKTPREERYDDDDRRQSEDICLAELIAKTLEGQRESRFSSTQQTAVRASALKDHRSRIRGIFMSARDDVLRGDELRDRQQERSVRPSGAQRAGGAGTSAGRRAATAPPSESPSTSPGHEREPHGRGQQRGKQQERAGQDSTTGHGSKGKQGERPRAAAAPAPAPAVVSVTEADRVRLAVYAVAAKLPRTQPYGNSSHRPPALSDERFNRMAAATDDEFVRKVIAAVQEKGNYYTDFERTESEKAHLRPAVGRMYQDALDEYEKAKAKRWIFSKRPPKPTWTEAEAAVIKEFISEQLGVIKEICREVQQRTPAAVRSELQRFEPGQVVTPRPSKSRTRATNQQGRGDSGPSR